MEGICPRTPLLVLLHCCGSHGVTTEIERWEPIDNDNTVMPTPPLPPDSSQKTSWEKYDLGGHRYVKIP